MSLHRDIMNLPFVEPKDVSAYRPEYAAKLGHRDARHAAAELAAPYDALVEQMAQALQLIVQWDDEGLALTDAQICKAKVALAKHAEVTGK